LFYIAGPQRLWYLKRGGNIQGIVSRSSMTMTFAAMHKLSELARYTPERLARHFECHHNWLLSEFIASAPAQFIDEISAEMTGQEFMMPGRASRR
jgi:YaaC-like Protein